MNNTAEMKGSVGRTARRSMAVAASGALVASAATVAVIAGTTASADATTASKSFTYTCTVTAGGSPIGTGKIKVQLSTKLPGKIKAGKMLSKRPIKAKLTMPEDLRAAAVDVLGATDASGKVKNAAMGVVVGKKKATAPLTGVNAKKAPIPAEEGAKWVVTAKGTLAAVKVPKKAKGKVTFSAPKKFQVNAKLYSESGTTPVVADCKAPKKRGFASVKITR